MNIKIMVRLIIIVICLLVNSSSYSQIFFRNQPKKYYEILIKNLHDPDSLYVYEVNSSWGSGIAYFISFKELKVRTGYYLNNNFLYKNLASRKLLPADSVNNIFRIVYDDVSYKSIIQDIEGLNILKLLDDYNIKDKCIKDNIADGSNYQLSKITKDTILYKSYYEIYEYAKLCPHIRQYQCFIKIDKSFQKYFNKSATILQSIINQFSKADNYP